MDFFQDFPQPHSSNLPLFVALNASPHETPFERNLNSGCHSLKSSVENRILHATVHFVGWPGHVMICVDCFWQLSEQAIRLSWDWAGHDHDLSNICTRLSCFYFQSTLAWETSLRKKFAVYFIASRGWASTCVRPEDARFSLFTGMLSMQKFASSNFGTTWPLYAMNQKCYYDCPKIIVVNSKHLK